MESVDKLQLEVLTRSGSNVTIHPDQARKWANCGGNIGAERRGINFDVSSSFRAG
jgi:hypothetical protein